MCLPAARRCTLILLITFALRMSLANAEYAGHLDNGHRVNKRSEPYADCRRRCERLLERSLARIGYTPKMINDEYSSLSIHNRLSGSAGPSLKDNKTYFNDICWKYFDYSDCAKQCEIAIRGRARLRRPHPLRKRRRQNMERLFHVATKLLLKDCKVSAPKKLLDQFRCVHKFRTFLDVQCSSYAKEAFHLRMLSLVTPAARQSQSKTRMTTKASNKTPPESDLGSNEEICRFLHYHSMCLANSIYQYCPSTTMGKSNGKDASDEESTSIFNRFTLRDYFLSYILPLPRQEELFSDVLLDECQLYDFQKMAKDIYASTKTHNAFMEIIKKSTKSSKVDVNNSESSEEAEKSTSTTPRRRSIADWFGYGGDSNGNLSTTAQPDSDASTVTTIIHRLFSSEEDLADTPPNFYYSSAKFANGATQNYNYYHRSTTKSINSDSLEASDSPEGRSHEIDGLTTLEQRINSLQDNSNNLQSTESYQSASVAIGITFSDKHPLARLPEPTGPSVSSNAIKTSASGLIRTSVRLPVDQLADDEYELHTTGGHHPSMSNKFSNTPETIPSERKDRPSKTKANKLSDKISSENMQKTTSNSFIVTKHDSLLQSIGINNNKHVNNHEDNEQNNNNNEYIGYKDGDRADDGINDRTSDGLDKNFVDPASRFAIPLSTPNSVSRKNSGDFMLPNSATGKNEKNDTSYTDAPSASRDNLLKVHNPPSTPMFMESRIHVKKIRPYENEAGIDTESYVEDQHVQSPSDDYDYTTEREFNWDDYYAENKNGDGVEGTYKDSTYSYDTSTVPNSNEDISYPYTITSVRPEDFVVYETKVWPVSSPSDATRVSSGAPTSIEHVPDQKLETWLVLLGIYSAFILVSLCSLLCIGCAYLVRRYQIYREGGGALKWSWISFDMQERL